MKSRLVQIAALFLLAAVPAGTARAEAPEAAEPARVAVITIKAIDGLDTKAENVQVVRHDEFTAGARYRVSRSVVPSLDNVKTLVLVERRVDSRKGNDVVQNITQQIVTSGGNQFTVKGPGDRDLNYTVDVLRDGSVDLIGPGDRIVVRGGGEYHIWKIEKTDLVNANRIVVE